MNDRNSPNPGPPGNLPPERPGRRDGASSRSESRRRRQRLRWILLFGFVALLGLGALAAKPTWRAIKAIRAQRFLAESDEFVKKEQWTQAFERSRSALQLAPLNPTVLRHAAQLYGRFGSEMALVYYQQLVSASQATPEDREAYAALALTMGDTGLAGGLIEALLERPAPSPRTLMLGSQYHALRRDFPRALTLARESVRAQPTNGTNVLALANMLGASRNRADHAEAIQALWPLARAEGPFQTRALAAIVNTPNSSREDREQVEAILAAKPARTVEEELLWKEVQVTLDPSQRNAIADDIVQRFGRGTEEEVAMVASWLNRQELHMRTLGLLLPDVARQSARLSRYRYEALLGIDDVRAAYDFIRDEKFQGDPVQVEFLRCTTAMKLKDEAATDLHLNNLLEMARNRPRQLRAVAEFARRNGKVEVANEANRILIRNPREAVPAFQSLLRTADAQGETWVARDYARKLAQLLKDDPKIRLQIAYYDLLLNENIDQALEISQRLQAEVPGDFNRRAVVGLAHLRRGEPQKAAAIIEGQVVTWNQLAPGVRAIVLATLGANNRQEAVARLATRIPLAPLKPEELDLIRPYLTGQAAEGDDPGDNRQERL